MATDTHAVPRPKGEVMRHTIPAACFLPLALLAALLLSIRLQVQAAPPDVADNPEVTRLLDDINLQSAELQRVSLTSTSLGKATPRSSKPSKNTSTISARPSRSCNPQQQRCSLAAGSHRSHHSRREEVRLQHHRRDRAPQQEPAAPAGPSISAVFEIECPGSIAAFLNGERLRGIRKDTEHSRGP